MADLVDQAKQIVSGVIKERKKQILDLTDAAFETALAQIEVDADTKNELEQPGNVSFDTLGDQREIASFGVRKEEKEMMAAVFDQRIEQYKAMTKIAEMIAPTYQRISNLVAPANAPDPEPQND